MRFRVERRAGIEAETPCIEADPLKSQVRRERRTSPALRGNPNAKGAAQGKRNRLEDHHVDGKRNNSKLTIPVCILGHRDIHRRACDAGADLREPPTVLHRLATVRRLRAALFFELGKAALREADELTDLIAGLDQDFPKWRNLPETK